MQAKTEGSALNQMNKLQHGHETSKFIMKLPYLLECQMMFLP